MLDVRKKFHFDRNREDYELIRIDTRPFGWDKKKAINTNVLKTGPSTGHKTGPVQCKKLFFD